MSRSAALSPSRYECYRHTNDTGNFDATGIMMCLCINILKQEAPHSRPAAMKVVQGY